MFHGVRTVMVLAEGPERCARRRAGVLGTEARVDTDKTAVQAVYAWLDVAGVEFGFHPLDEERNRRGGSPVPCWAVDDVGRVRDRLPAAGRTHHRGPLRIAPGPADLPGGGPVRLHITDVPEGSAVRHLATAIGLDGP
ncbi:VOC family protein [Streptomyces sp. NPDC058382]|uniref:VOC family protein n=1 Tax=unclassified Streptomyces TaxID=2593676 RepID=UPI0036305ABA